MPHGEVQLFDDIWDAILNDGFMWIVIWGPPRCSKTTLAYWMKYNVYRDWEKCHSAILFNLSQFMYKLQHGVPDKMWTKNGLHNRVPILNWDDYGSQSNKAVTQYDEAWDYFKGGWDILGTKIGVIIATMVDPTEPTLQLQNKYTHEIQVLDKGEYKYDRVEWIQDYKGWKTKVHKHFVEHNYFDPLPASIYNEYDQMRMSLADEVLLNIEDRITMSQGDWTMKLLKPMDYNVLQAIETYGPITWDRLTETAGEDGKGCLTRMKARGLLVPIHIEGTYYKYDMTRLGKDLLDAWKKKQEVPTSPIVEVTKET